ncbi:sulfotransferase [Paracoccus sediminis]|uniref:Sulfotransferase domain-containing protein n=1 Tax=Paracoccus sediminis TaxID=1214787 RepID=A0A238Y696_9RHOB|nr:sulfotransferase [Paracoccus sediminis]SNR66627.1 Sulfotransferase domain-containing protein [Paracoccus sediminis]
MADPARFSANAFLIGAQKSGTTWLASLLEQSPDICVSDPKEPQFFTRQFGKGEDFYRGCFARPDAPVRLDASTTYSFLRPAHALDDPDAPGLLDPVPQRIAEWAPDARFIYVLRDPVGRAASAYRHSMRMQPPPKGPVSMLDCLRDQPMLGLISRYGDQIERYLAVFPRDRFLFLDFRDLTADPGLTVRRVCDFLGAAQPDLRLSAAEEDKHPAYRLTPVGQAVHRLRKALPGLAGTLQRNLPRPLERYLSHRVARAPASIALTHQAEAAALFRADLDRVEALTGLRL